MLSNYPGRTGVAMGEEFLDLVADNDNVRTRVNRILDESTADHD